jgi:hypothetical protein
MKRIAVGAAVVLVALAVGSCSSASSTSSTSSTVSSLASNPLVSSLSSGIGISPTQAVAGAGAVLGSAQANLSPTDWKKVTDAVPSTDALVSEAKKLTGVTGSFGNWGSLGDSLSKLGLSSEQISKLVPGVTDYVSKAAGPQVSNLLAGALR